MATPSGLSLLARSPLGILPRVNSTRVLAGGRSRASVRCEAADSETPTQSPEGDEDDFEKRLARLTSKKTASGSGKKAEARKLRRDGTDADVALSTARSSSDDSTGQGATPEKKSALFLTDYFPLPERKSGGLNVELGFTPFAERVNGQLALIGLGALLSVEAASGTSLLQYHDGATLAVQVYVALCAGAVYVKACQEKDGVWPK